MPTYGNQQGKVNITQASSMSNGSTSNSLMLQFPNHIGTHIDFPKHFCNNGKSLSDYADDFWFFNKIGFIESSFAELETILNTVDNEIEILIVKTGFEQFRGTERYTLAQPVIEPYLASLLKHKFKNLRVLGFDMISISSYLDRKKGREAHHAFLCDNDILLLEDMRLQDLRETPQSLIVAPLQIKKADGVPCFVYAFHTNGIMKKMSLDGYKGN